MLITLITSYTYRILADANKVRQAQDEQVASEKKQRKAKEMDAEYKQKANEGIMHNKSHDQETIDALNSQSMLEREAKGPHHRDDLIKGGSGYKQ